MVYRDLGSSGAYPRWATDLRGKSGYYVVRDRSTHEVLYVGESHSDRLYQTLTRHFQYWRGPTAGATYSRGDVEVGVRVTSRGRAVAAQDAAICRLGPRDNVQESCEEAPF